MSWRSQAIHTAFCENSRDTVRIKLATNYRVETRVLVQAVKRNIERFPEDFMLQLSSEEVDFLRSQIVTLKKGRGQHSKYLPYAFTEQGVAMLSSVLRSRRAIQVNIEIMRAFIRLRQCWQAMSSLLASSTHLRKSMMLNSNRSLKLFVSS
jgi:hypothetical protein